MKANEKIVIDSYEITTVKDDWEKGEVGGTVSEWTQREIPVCGQFDSVSDALKAVCKANNLEFSSEGWTNWLKEYGEDGGRYDTDYNVDENNLELTTDEYEAWKSGKFAVYALRLAVWLKVQTVARDLTDEDMDM